MVVKLQKNFFSHLICERKSQIIFLFLIAFVIRTAVILTLEDRLYWPDEQVFDSIALSLLKGDGYVSDPFRANPVLPSFLAGVYKIFGYNYLAPRIIQGFIGSLTVIIIYAIAQRLYNRRVAFLAGSGMALYPPLVYACGIFYVLCLFTFLMALSVYLLSLSREYEGIRSSMFLILSGIVIGITILCRPIFLAFIPFAFIFVIFSSRGEILHRVAYGALLLLITFLTIFPWTLRNYVQYERPILVSTGGGLFLWRGNNELTRGDTADRYLMPGFGETWTTRLEKLEPDHRRALTQKYDKVQQDLQSIGSIDHDKYLQKLAFAFIIQHPGRSLELFIQKLHTLYAPFSRVQDENRDIISKKKRLILAAIFYPMLLLGLFGMLNSLRTLRQHFVLYLPIVALTLVYGVLTAATRFRLPIDPYIIIFASSGIIVIWDLGSRARRRPLCIDETPASAFPEPVSPPAICLRHVSSDNIQH
jgi:4-amino-4-deoxy-L-arabinose transferase-like glycosyltransferase